MEAFLRLQVHMAIRAKGRTLLESRVLTILASRL